MTFNEVRNRNPLSIIIHEGAQESMSPARGTIERGLSSETALALTKHFLQSPRVLDALDLGVYALAARGFSSSTLADGGDLTSALQSDMGFELLLGGF